MNLQLTQEVLLYRIFNDSNSQKCCPDGHLTLNSGFERRIRTSPGEFKMDFWRIRCSKCCKNRMIILKRFTNVKVWEECWQNEMNCVDNVVVNIGNYKCFSPDSGQ